MSAQGAANDRPDQPASLKIALVGFGSMGKAVADEIANSASPSRSHTVHSIIDPTSPRATHNKLSSSAIAGADIVVDFSAPGAVIDNLRCYVEHQVPTVIGTTGWYDNLLAAEQLVKASQGKVLWSSNFSIGVNLFYRVIEATASLFANVEDYDVWGYELHHHNKADSPSGTAKSAVELLLKQIPRKRRVVYDKLDRKIAPDEIHFASVRGGSVNFEHTIGFDSAADTILIQHRARNRSGYASGAITAAEWLAQQDAGFYSFADFMSALLHQRVGEKH